MMEIFAESKKFEREAIIFYEFLSSFLDDEKSSRQMKIIIGEERRHIKELERMEKISGDFC